MKVIDSHIHIEQYNKTEQKQIISSLPQYGIDYLIAVSNNWISAKHTLQLADNYGVILPAIGYHPEQSIPTEKELQRIFDLIEQYKKIIVAIGEVGLPYYKRMDNPELHYEAYVRILEQFIEIAAVLKKPIVLHAIYDDAKIALKLLKKYDIKKAHFHWFKGEEKILEDIVHCDYVISVPPEVCYRDKIQKIARSVPMTNLLVESDGPWAYEGPFKGERTHPKMLHDCLVTIAKLKQRPLDDVYEQIYMNTINFYEI